MDNEAFLKDRLCYWLGVKLLIQEGSIRFCPSIREELEKVKTFFKNANLDTKKTTVSKQLARLLDLKLEKSYDLPRPQ